MHFVPSSLALARSVWLVVGAVVALFAMLYLDEMFFYNTELSDYMVL